MPTKTRTLEERIIKELRVKPKTLKEIAAGMEVPYQMISKKINQAVDKGHAQRTDTEPATYSTPKV